MKSNVVSRLKILPLEIGSSLFSGFSDPLPCPGIGGFYLAISEGWSTTYARRLEAMIPADLLMRPSKDQLYSDQIDLLFNYSVS